MVFVINELKYDTDKMELISEKCEYTWNSILITTSITCYAKNVKLWRSKKGNWLLTYEKEFGITRGVSLPENGAKELLLQYDIDAYEKIFGELEEA